MMMSGSMEEGACGSCLFCGIEERVEGTTEARPGHKSQDMPSVLSFFELGLPPEDVMSSPYNAISNGSTV